MARITVLRRVRWLTFLLVLLSVACASSPRAGSYSRLVVLGDEIRTDGYSTAFEALTHHRDIVLIEDQIGFRGGYDSAFGRSAQEFYQPLLVINGNYRTNDPITALRRISAEDIVTIRLYKASMVPPLYRRPGAEGGVIEVTTH